MTEPTGLDRLLGFAPGRMTRTVAGDEDHRSFLTAGGINQNSFNLGKFQTPSTVMIGSNQFRQFNQLVGVHQGYAPQVDASHLNGAEKEIAASNLLGSRKRARETEELRSQWLQQRQLLMNSVSDFHQNTGPGSVVNPQSTGVSTGLRLTFEDDRLRSSSPVSTSGRVEATKNSVSSMTESFGTHLQQERNEIDHLLKIQSEQLKAFLEEKRQRHSRQLVAAVEERYSRRLREKDLEVEKVKRQNQELMERFTQLNAESHHWQNKLRTTEAMMTVLKSNLHQTQQQQQGYPLSREQSKEGCGDSEADDCASSYVDDRNDAHTRTFNENKELREQRTCRVCRCNDVSVLLLPCRHLCLCQDCEGQLHACPLCRTPKNASVQVYMS
ncbi:probable BOI-related E3 ubiquitin-protein ligase 2 isoform X2 [Physcomitrium patens]|uniref:probable BOI-related E3 ubiquitin-protein ligase 2 isoform X2 n=1 Tax=Physcomitrium patens TaxID=3218 RepID=UPI000D1776F5|nr:probable BOI-related E3 ubiquitin-protein ligase 2 isoform X2 [Physcomitrium patens]|eukprot:XP_024360982.1 probable BOI-related E3 ubiquitin-protein ligase 2 isoform X2 [Physcomitrella patens]